MVLNVQYVKSLKKMLIIEISLVEIENMRISDLARCVTKEIPLFFLNREIIPGSENAPICFTFFEPHQGISMKFKEVFYLVMIICVVCVV